MDKHLAKKDIEELGFNQVGYVFNKPLFSNGVVKITFDDIKKEVCFKNIDVSVFKIQNKAELEKLLKQLGI
tara:strand:+ start:498 stop:710 length:213 start_codon:yes stop_codon:yes gene_type:complete